MIGLFNGTVDANLAWFPMLSSVHNDPSLDAATRAEVQRSMETSNSKLDEWHRASSGVCMSTRDEAQLRDEDASPLDVFELLLLRRIMRGVIEGLRADLLPAQQEALSQWAHSKAPFYRPERAR
jgi:hypothetical protein